MQQVLLRYIGLPLLTIASALAFYYLNHVELPEPAKTVELKQKEPQKERKVVITNPVTQKKQLIIIAPPKWMDTVVTDSPKVQSPPTTDEDPQGVLPDVEFLKFVIQKSRDGIPVLSFKDYLNLSLF